LRTADIEGVVRLRDVQTLRGGQPIHEPVSIELMPGEIVAVVGQSGAGKSSLVAALLGFVSHRGEITTANSDTPLREQIAWVPQDPQLFMGTVASNVALGSEVELEAVKTALGDAGLAELDSQLVLGVHGQGLSGGQAQRLSLARAYYRLATTPASILILDEVTSALDEDTEDVVWRGIEHHASHGIAVMVISHRLRVNERAHRRVSITPLRQGVVR
jgi:ATP-binding cassette subfamily C protein CydD